MALSAVTVASTVVFPLSIRGATVETSAAKGRSSCLKRLPQSTLGRHLVAISSRPRSSCRRIPVDQLVVRINAGKRRFFVNQKFKSLLFLRDTLLPELQLLQLFTRTAEH